MTRAERLTALAQLFEEWTEQHPAAELVPREEAFLTECRRADVRLEEVLAAELPDKMLVLLDETLALAVQKNFFLDKSFEELFYRRYHARLFKWLSYSDPDEHRCCDVVQMLYIKFYAPVRSGKPLLPGFDSSKVFRTWLYVVARNFWIATVARKRQLRLRSEWNDQAGPDTVEQEILARELPAAVARLSAEEREPMRLSLDGHPRQEIAKMLGIAVERVDRLLHKARRQLAKLLDMDVPPSGSGRKKPPGSHPETRSC